jgi:hypothetical protein
MTIGYPDYARLSQDGGTQLYAANNISPPENTVLFKGYVGSWPYVNLITNCNSTVENAQFKMQYFNDATFTTLVGEHHCTRASLNFAYTQYANMSPFMQFFYVTETGNPFPISQLNLYATTGKADSKSLYDLSEGILVGTESIAASTTSTHFPVLINPGRTTFQLQTAGASWFINVLYFSFQQNGYILYKQFNSAKWGQDVQVEFPMLDAPHKVEVHNTAASATTFVYGWASD